VCLGTVGLVCEYSSAIGLGRAECVILHFSSLG